MCLFIMKKLRALRSHVVNTPFGNIGISPQGAEVHLVKPFDELSGLYPWRLMPVLYAMARAAVDEDSSPDALVSVTRVVSGAGFIGFADCKVDKSAEFVVAVADKITRSYPLLLQVSPPPIGCELERLHDMTTKEVSHYCATTGLQTGLSFLHERAQRSGHERSLARG